MKPDFNNIPLDDLCQMIDMLDPSMDNYLFVFNLQKDYFHISPHAVQRFAIEENTFDHATKAMELLVYPQDYNMLQMDLRDVISSNRIQNLTYRWMSREGEPIWVNARGYTVRDDRDNALYLVGCINEIGKYAQKADNLSGLLSLTSLQTYLIKYENKFPDGYFLRVGLDNLKAINARLGVAYGDIVLRKTAEILSHSLVLGQEIFRIFGDEFLIIDFMGNGANEAHALFARIQDAINDYIIESNYKVVFTVSAGFLSCADIEQATYAQMMSLTEFALDQAKRQGKNMCYVYRREDYQDFLKRKNIMLQLRQAVNHDFEGFEVYYQPLFDQETGQLACAEALMRFNSKTYGKISPSEFIPLLEDSALIVPAGRWILREALKMCKHVKQFIPSFHISVNLSYVQILRSRIEDDIIAALEEFGLSPEDVMVELTESGLLESNTRFSDFWGKLKAAGVPLALDDFGSGYSNFRYLAELGPDMVKIDRTFTEGAMRSSYEYELLSLFSKMVHQLKLKICVEGVETEMEFEKICQLPPEYIQGYYFGRPCGKEKFLEQFVTPA